MLRSVRVMRVCVCVFVCVCVLCVLCVLRMCVGAWGCQSGKCSARGVVCEGRCVCHPWCVRQDLVCFFFLFFVFFGQSCARICVYSLWSVLFSVVKCVYACVLQCFAVLCSVLQCFVVFYKVL